MAIESDRVAASSSAERGAPSWIAGATRQLRDFAQGASQAGGWLTRQANKVPVDRFFTSLARRIFVANLLGLVILISGIIYYAQLQGQGLLIDAKTESLRVQGQIIAAAIAANAKVVGRGGITLDPAKLPNVEDARIPFRDDGFATLELSLSPEKVTPILKRLIKPINTRARIYSLEYALVFDSNQMLSYRMRKAGRTGLGGEQKGSAAPSARDGRDGPPPMRSFWTRVNEWFTPSGLPVYYEVDNADGRRYKQVRAAMAGGQPSPMVLINPQGQQMVAQVTPIKRLGNVHGVLVLSTRPGEIDTILTEERRVIMMVSLMALMATIVASIILNYTISMPMKKLSAAAKHVRGNIKARTELPQFPGRTDEVGQLSVAFREMTSALFRRIEASEKFAGDVAHELKNPLTAARATAEALTYAKTEESRAERVQQIQKELQRLNRLITDVSNVSRLDAELAWEQSEPFDMRHVVTNVVNVFNDLLSNKNCRIELDLPDLPKNARDFVVAGQEGRYDQVITNLVDNAVSFSPDGGIVTVRARRIGAEVELSVEDQGPGIPGDLLEKIFDRFYSDRPDTEGEQGKNSGLGLSISREIVKAHKGRIWAENLGTPLAPQSRNTSSESANRAGDGTAFVIRLPAAYPLSYRRRNRNGRRR